MTPYQQIPQPVPMYTDLRYQYARRRECANTNFNVFHRNNDLPFFLIVRETSPYNEFTLKLVNLAGDEVDMGSVPVTIRTVPNPKGTDEAPLPDLDYISIAPLTTLSEPIPTGIWWMEWRDNAGGSDTSVYYSEPINFVDCYDTLIRVSFGDTCSRLGIPFGEFAYTTSGPGGDRTNYRHFSFWIDRGLGVPRTATESEVEDNGREMRIKSQRTVRYWVINDLLPDYIVRSLHAAKYFAGSGTVEVYDPSTDLTATVLEVGTITAEWAPQGSLANTNVEMRLDDEWRDGCCDTNLTVQPCGNEDATEVEYGGESEHYGWHDTTQAEGSTYLILNATEHDMSPFSGQLWDVATKTAGGYSYETPAIGTIIRLGEEVFSTDIYNATGLLFEVIEDPGDPSGHSIVNMCPPPVITPMDGTNTTWLVTTDYTTETITEWQRFARIIVSTSLEPGHPSEVIVWDGTEEELLDNPPEVTNPYNTEVTYTRIQYYKHSCDYGLSAFTATDAYIDPCAGADTFPTLVEVDFSCLSNQRSTYETFLTVGQTVIIYDHPSSVPPGTDPFELHTGCVATRVADGTGEAGGNWTYFELTDGDVVHVAAEAGNPEEYLLVVSEVGGTFYVDNGGTGLFTVYYFSPIVSLDPGPPASTELFGDASLLTGKNSTRLSHIDVCRSFIVEYSNNGNAGPWFDTETGLRQESALYFAPGLVVDMDDSGFGMNPRMRTRWERGGNLQGYSITSAATT